MNTKTSYKCVHNFYDGSNHGVGRDSPGALLDMLAEVASQTLHSEARHIESDLLLKNKQKADTVKRKAQEVYLNLPQILSLPASQLVKHFAVFTSDELKRQYSYMCALVPGCEQKYTSFASEGKARVSITAHLIDHLDYLKNDEDAYTTFKATTVQCASVKYNKPKPGIQAKKHKTQQSKKPQETPNKENKIVKSEKSTSYLRKILSNEMNFKEFEKQKKLENQNRGRETCAIDTKKDTDLEIEFKVLGDHSYYEQVKTEPMDEGENMQEQVINGGMSENIMLMVVESDSVHMKEMPYISEDMASQSNQVQDCKSWSEEMCDRSSESTVPAKPKGKAKFIGTSKEEREMALVLIERIKKKGNPTGNNLQCRICDPPRSFTAPTTLVSHYRSHAGIKPYECRICRSVFTRRHSLKYHMLIHQNQTRFTCADCGKKFRHPSHFREHRRRHTGESPFGCEDCGQRFKTRNTYKRHLKTRHGKVLTTTGELLLLTEEEFQKVQTNRKRKSNPSVSSDALPNEDIAATESIVEYSHDRCNDNVHENNNETIEDFHVQAMSAQTRNDVTTVVVDGYKTDTIETEIIVENTSHRVNETNDDRDRTNDRSLYRNNVDDDRIEYENSSLKLFRSSGENENLAQRYFENHVRVVEEVEVKTIVTDNVEFNDRRDDEPRDDVTIERDVVSINPEEIEYCQEFCDVQQNETTQLEVQYAYKIRGNVQYQLHVVPSENMQYENSQNYDQSNEQLEFGNEANFRGDETSGNDDEYREIDDNEKNECRIVTTNRRSVESKNDDSSARVENSDRFESKTTSSMEISNVPGTVNNGTILILSEDSLKSGYFRIDSDNIVVKDVNGLASIAVTQK